MEKKKIKKRIKELEKISGSNCNGVRKLIEDISEMTTDFQMETKEEAELLICHLKLLNNRIAKEFEL